MAKEAADYSVLREAHRPKKVRLLLVGESAPDPGSGKLRFFYAPFLDRHDNLFRAIVAALYDCSPGHVGAAKKPFHDRFVNDGVFLIDLVPKPIDKAKGQTRAKARRDNVGGCVARARGLNAEGIVICHKPSFEVLAGPMRDAKLPLLHDEPIPFPLAQHRQTFVEMLRTAVQPFRPFPSQPIEANLR